jgi:hypothetical protein
MKHIKKKENAEYKNIQQFSVQIVLEKKNLSTFFIVEPAVG